MALYKYSMHFLFLSTLVLPIITSTSTNEYTSISVTPKNPAIPVAVDGEVILTQQVTSVSDGSTNFNVTKSPSNEGVLSPVTGNENEILSNAIIKSTSAPSDNIASSTKINLSTKVQSNKIENPYDETSFDNVCNRAFSLEDTKPRSEAVCLCDSRLLVVDCSHLGLTKLPPHLTFPARMVSINFRGNRIKVIDTDTFYNGREALELDLSNNDIDFLSAEAFKGFYKLHRLSLQHNGLWNLNEKTFDGLSHLRSLDLGFNELDELFIDLFKSMPELKELSLEGNQLQALKERQFEHLTNLEILDLNSIMLQTLPEHVFVYTSKLRTLALANNRLAQIPSKALKNLIHLRTLDLSGNPIRVLGPQSFISMESLTVLYLNQMPHLQSIEAHALGDLKQLREFHCNYNFVLSEIHQEAFINKSNRQRVSVEKLFLRQNNLAMISPWLQKWHPNMELQLSDNPWDCNCQIYWLLDLQTKSKFQDHVKCESPLQLRGRTLGQLKADDLPCGIALSDVIMIAAAATIGVMLLLLVVAFLLHKRSYARSHAKRFKYTPSNSEFEDVVYSKTYETMDMY